MHKTSSNNLLIENLNFLISKNNISIPELSKLTGVPKVTLYNLVAEVHQPRLALIKALSQFFKVTVSQLIGETPLTLSNISVPILSWNSINYKAGHIDFIHTQETEYILVNNSKDHHMFALLIENNNYPMYNIDDTLIFSKQSKLENRSIVLMSQEKTEPILKTVIIEGKAVYLKSISNDVPTQLYDPANAVIFGVLREVRISKF